MEEKLPHLIARLCSTYGKPLDEMLIVSYTGSLKDTPLPILREAFDRCIRESQWMPKPAEILQAAREIQLQANPRAAEPAHHKLDAYLCPICRDTGYVTVWTPDAMRWAIDHVKSLFTTPRGRVTECAAKCTCARGQTRPGNARTFDAKFMVTVTRRVNRVDDLIQWAKGHLEQRGVA